MYIHCMDYVYKSKSCIDLLKPKGHWDIIYYNKSRCFEVQVLGIGKCKKFMFELSVAHIWNHRQWIDMPMRGSLYNSTDPE